MENRGIGIKIRDGEDIEISLQRFKRKLKKDNRFLEIRKHDFYVKPSDRKKMKKRRKKTVGGQQL